MKPKTLIFLILFIVLVFLAHGGFLVYDIQQINKSLLSQSDLSPENLKNFSDHIDQFQYFLYLFGVLICSIAVSLIRIERIKKPSKKECIQKLLQIKKKAKMEKSTI